MKQSLLSVVSIAAFLAPAADAAQFDYVAQARSLALGVSANDAGGSPVTDGVTIAAPDFSPFQATDTVAITEALGSASATGTHISALLADRMEFSASTNGSAQAPSLQSGAGASSSSTSTFFVTFDLAAPTYCSLGGQFTFEGQGSTPGIFLNGPGGLVWADEATQNSSQVPTAFAGVLAPGQYTLSCDAFAGEFADEFSSFGGSSSVDFVFAAEPLIGTNYCTSAPNSAGTAATIAALGSSSAADQNLTLLAEGLVPSSFGLFFFGPIQANQPLGGGTLCVGGSLVRLHSAEAASPSGSFLHVVDFSPGTSADQLLQAGSTWNFQLWYRDSGDPLGSNTTDGLTISFQ